VATPLDFKGSQMVLYLRSNLLRFLSHLILAVALFASEVRADEAAFAGLAKLGRGINILGYDGIWEGASNSPFRTENLRMIKEAGFSHVRINFFGFKHMNSENIMDNTVLERLDTVIEEVVSRHLIPILDEHDNNYCQRYLASCAEKLKAFWKQISTRYQRKYPSLIFEILNEPGGNMSAATWNSLLTEVLSIIRNTNSERLVIVAALNTEGVTIDQLILPAHDRNLIATFHYYDPMEFTHQGAPWSRKFSSLGPTEWGSAEEKNKITSEFRKIKLWSEKENRPIYLGEFGVFERAPERSRSQYLSFVARSAEQFGWAWAYWQFDHDFAAFDSLQQRWKPDVLDALVP
jgi:endoglucanase